MSWRLETVSSVPFFLRKSVETNPILPALDSFQVDLSFDASASSSQQDLRFLCDIIMRILHRGKCTLPSVRVERFLAIYGQDFNLKEKPLDASGCIEWQWNGDLTSSLNNFTDCILPWSGDASTVSFDPNHPENEARLFKQLTDYYGPRFAPCVHTQVLLSDILPPEQEASFQRQRVDFLIAFPNGRCFVLEPGDHDAGATPLAQREKDKQRDIALSKIGIRTLRIDNRRIGSANLIKEIDTLVRECAGHPYLNKVVDNNPKILRQNYLLLAPTLIARIEYVLAFFLLQRNLIARETLDICIHEQDLECAELAILSFFDRLHRLSKLYGISCPTPHISLIIFRNGQDNSANIAPIVEELNAYNIHVEQRSSFTGRVDLAIDTAIKTNHLTLPSIVPAECSATIRNAFPHSHKYQFWYSSTPRNIQLGDDDETIITSFLNDFFRKRKLRDGQMPIIRNILSQKATIGLLPTSAGKSICYQLSSILTPGITIIVDPIIFLMKDQVLSLSESFGITNIAAWHSESGIIRDDQIGELMASNIMIFMSPERFLRPSFRSAMKNLLAGDLYINYAVIDEAHCVSMWGHDFRPPYLMLERCFREYCTLRNHAPVVVALTGTASQLVLIDLKRELKIDEFEAIIRPKSFERKELTYNVMPCESNQKRVNLKRILKTISNRIGVDNVLSDSWGVLFAHYPKQVWDLYYEMAGKADEHISEIAKKPQLIDEIPFGIACGGTPKDSPVPSETWKNYKNLILHHFKRGRVRLLIGNAAIGVGIDNEYLNYVVVYCMPSSLESLGQQWGRAGRRGQPSQCYLLVSDDRPIETDNWLNNKSVKLNNRYDDIGTVAYFHSQSFPGESEDIEGTQQVFSELWRTERDTDGRRSIHGGTNERIQRYISFLIMMGCAEDYSVTGMDQNTIYHVKIHPIIEDCALNNDEPGIRNHLIYSLQSYLSRYRPTTQQEIIAGLDAQQEDKLSSRAIGYLIKFIYDRIAYQRKESIRTILSFCRQDDQSPDSISLRIKAFFDRNPKFSDQLDAMANDEINIDTVIQLVRLIDGYDDVEHLYWETRRLLDERFRADWAAINLYAAIYRELKISDSSQFIFSQLTDELRSRLSMDSQTLFLIGFFNSLGIIDGVTDKNISGDLLPELFLILYNRFGYEYLPVLDGLTCSEESLLEIRGKLSNYKLEDILNGIKHKHGIG